MKKFFYLSLGMAFIWPLASMAQINVNLLNKAVSYAINLDSLARTGTSSTMPAGWHLYQSDGRTTYKASVGDSANAGVYSFGTATGFQARVRALGSISSPKDTTYFGAEFVNNTGYPLNTILVAYTIEQWRLGATGRGPDISEFDYSTDATGLRSNGATWTNVSALDMVSPVTSGTAGALNGLLPANQSKLSFKITGLAIAPGAHFWIRWYDHVISGPNDGLGIQALSMTYYSILAGPTIVKKIALAKVALPTTPGIPDTTIYCKFHGIVLSPNFVSNGGLQFSIRDTFASTGFQAGVGAITCISATDISGYSVNIGDSVYVTGKMRSYKYLAYIQLDTLIVLQANKVANPAYIPTNNLAENYESNLVKLSNVTLAPTATWDTTGASVLGGFTTTARTAGGANIIIFINKNSDLFLKQKINFPFNITGIELQSSTTPNGGYFIWPRFIKDIDTLPQPVIPLRNIGQINTYRTTAFPPQLIGRADSVNKKFFIKGVVHSPNLYYGGVYFNVIDNTGAITVYNVASVSGYTPVIGDSVLVRGTVLQLTGLIVIAADSIKRLSQNATLTPPKSIAGPITKPIESYLLTLKSVRIIDATLWDSANATTKTLNMFEVKITNGKDTFFMDIAKTTDLFKKSSITGLFDVTGVVGENSTNLQLPYNDHYLIIPRGTFDIHQGIIPTYKIVQVKGFNAVTGIPDSLGVTCFLKGVIESGNISDSLTSPVAYSMFDNTGAITVADLINTGYVPAMGDSVIALGTVSQNAGLTYFYLDSIHKISPNNALVQPVVLNALNESLESAVITVQGYTMWNPNQWDNLIPANKTGFNVQFVKGTDTVIVHISRNVPSLYNLPYASKPIWKVDITGVELQKTTAKDPFANYYIVPRMLSDISFNTGIENQSGIESKINIYPNPAHDNVTIYSTSEIEYLSLSDIIGNKLMTIIGPKTDTQTIDMTTLKPGIYLVKIKNGEGISVQKLIKE